MEKTLKNRGGFTLAEILIAMLIIALSALFITKFSKNALMMSKDSRGRDAACTAAEDKISELALAPFQGATTSDQVTIDNITYSRSWSVQGNSYIKHVIVTVTYTSLNGTSRQVTLAGAIN